MFQRIKSFFESLVYAGLKPSTPGAPTAVARTGAFGRFRDSLDRYLAGPAAADPLYLSNRTIWQKLKPVALIAIPTVILLGGLAFGILDYMGKAGITGPPPVGLSNAEIARKMLPSLNQDLHVVSQHDLDVQDVRILQSAGKISGIAKNNTSHVIHHADIVFELTDRLGSRQGAVATQIAEIGPNATVPFQFPIVQKTASFALVREVHIN